MRTIRNCGVLVTLPVLLGAALFAGSASAQNYPAKVIHIHTTGVGGPGDQLSRLVAGELSTQLGQQVVVDNKAVPVLASGVAKSPPDGYTLLITAGTLWISPLFGEVPYDALRDFAPISRLTRASSALIVNASLPVKSVADLIKLAKAKPGELNYSTGSDGAASHIAGELFKSLGGVNIVRVVYKDSGDVPDLIAGRLQMTFGSPQTFVAATSTGKARVIATTGAQRSAQLPDVPTLNETLPGAVAEQLLSMLAPAKTPDAIIRRLNQEVTRALAKPDVRDRLLKVNLEASTSTPEELTAAMKSDIAVVSKVLKDAGVKPGKE